MIIVKCKSDTSLRNLGELQKVLSENSDEEIIVIPNNCDVIYSDSPTAHWSVQNYEEREMI